MNAKSRGISDVLACHSRMIVAAPKSVPDMVKNETGVSFIYMSPVSNVKLLNTWGFDSHVLEIEIERSRERLKTKHWRLETSD